MRFVDPRRRLAATRERADLARRRFNAALNGTRNRLAPDRLKAEALVVAGDKLDEAKRAARQSLRRHPFLAVSATLGGLAIMFWAPARHLALFGTRASQLIWVNRKLWRTRND